ncbi:hypothetical protein ZHAS_00017685 [Anopheles sinensis]|uniref:Uncharacterized protein n=1 Tax=Anopheles sinensis TaxID=74873 RepID=A0A084WGZ0_ANOSI|nr:hypothetical protein ZHAS_00017685 [Anopheles sinensis]
MVCNVLQKPSPDEGANTRAKDHSPNTIHCCQKPNPNTFVSDRRMQRIGLCTLEQMRAKAKRQGKEAIRVSDPHFSSGTFEPTIVRAITIINGGDGAPGRRGGNGKKMHPGRARPN